MSIFRKISRLPVWKLRRTNTLNYFKFQNFSQKIPDLEELDIDENIKNDKRRVLDDGKESHSSVN